MNPEPDVDKHKHNGKPPNNLLLEEAISIQKDQLPLINKAELNIVQIKAKLGVAPEQDKHKQGREDRLQQNFWMKLIVIIHQHTNDQNQSKRKRVSAS